MENVKVAIVIPTYQRIKKLKKCLYSLSNQTYQNFDIHIYCDNNDKETFNYFADSPLNTWTQYGAIKQITVNDKQEFVIGSWNKFFTQYHNQYDAVAWIVDDVELHPTYIEELVKSMQTNFPDLDGVVGAKQECPGRPDYTFKWYGQCLIGRKFIERYKEVDYAVCCPYYKHFYQDEEMWMFANSLGKFVNCETAILNHYHPAFVPEEMDATHPIVRGQVKKNDDAVYRMRREKNLVWGQTWQEK